jgi:hypothetical protein
MQERKLKLITIWYDIKNINNAYGQPQLNKVTYKCIRKLKETTIITQLTCM